MESNLFELRITQHGIVTLTASVLPGSANPFSEHEAAGLIALAIRPFRLPLRLPPNPSRTGKKQADHFLSKPKAKPTCALPL